MDCLFCKIIHGEIPANIIYRDEQVMVFDDIHPQAPHHKIIIPRKHVATLNDLENTDASLVTTMIQRAIALTKELNIADEGYRLVMNCNTQGGQTISHIHLHLLGGRSMTWPPG